MPLKLRITSHQAQSLGVNAAREFSEAGGTIGRSSSSDWTLPDPERFISGQHAAIRFDGGAYYLDDLSVNGVYVNGSPDAVGKGNAIRLSSGDQLVFGEYEMSVSWEADLPDDPFAPEPPPVAPEDPFAPPAVADPFAPAQDSYSTPPTTDPFGLGGAQNSAASAPASDPFGLGVAAPQPQSPAPQAPDPFAPQQPGRNPYDSAPSLTSPPVGASTAGSSDSLVDPQQSLDPLDLLGGQAAPSAPPTAAPGAMRNNQPDTSDFFTPPAASSDQIPENWDMTQFDAPAPAQPQPQPPAQAQPPAPAPAPPAAPQPQQAAPGAEPQVPPQAWSPPPAPSPPSQHAATPPATGQAGAADMLALRALLEGAGIPPSKVPPGSGPYLMTVAGQIFREVVQGMMDVLVARASLKSEFRMALTTIRPVENNPLKFSPSVDEALENLLLNDSRGYLPPVEAVQEGFNDIRAHQMSMIAGMRAAFDVMMRRIDPVTLSAQFDKSLKRGLLGGIAGKSRYWEMYAEIYDDWTRDPDECFRNLFGNEFARAYENQMTLMSKKGKDK